MTVNNKFVIMRIGKDVIIMNTSEIIWAVAVLGFIIVEASTAGLVSIWFAVGAFVAFIATLLGAGSWLQFVLFLVVSVVSFLFLRKYAVKSIKNNPANTDLDRLIGSQVVVTEEVDNNKNTGSAQINDVVWRIKSADGEIINAGEIVTVEKIEGVKLVVRR